jgi:hypothetical protein
MRHQRQRPGDQSVPWGLSSGHKPGSGIAGSHGTSGLTLCRNSQIQHLRAHWQYTGPQTPLLAWSVLSFWCSHYTRCEVAAHCSSDLQFFNVLSTFPCAYWSCVYPSRTFFKSLSIFFFYFGTRVCIQDLALARVTPPSLWLWVFRTRGLTFAQVSPDHHLPILCFPPWLWWQVCTIPASSIEKVSCGLTGNHVHLNLSLLWSRDDRCAPPHPATGWEVVPWTFLLRLASNHNPSDLILLCSGMTGASHQCPVLLLSWFVLHIVQFSIYSTYKPLSDIPSNKTTSLWLFCWNPIYLSFSFIAVLLASHLRPHQVRKNRLIQISVSIP